MKTKIEWTERTWNPVTGCTKIAQGCKNCYAETMFNRLSSMDFKGNVYKGRKFTDVQIHPERLDEPYKWKKPCMVFVNSMADLFHERVPFEFIDLIYAMVSICKQHIFQILTKRPERALEYYNFKDKSWRNDGMQGFERVRYQAYHRFGKNILLKDFNLDNIWLGTSISTQEDAGKNIPLLLEIPAAVRWVSIEPMLGEVDFNLKAIGGTIEANVLTGKVFNCFDTSVKHELSSKLDWVVVGCESGHGRRECKIEWVESIVNQCKLAGVPVFVKQLQINGKVEKDINKFPKHLQIREYPECK